MLTAVILGITGQDGIYLEKLLEMNSIKVYGVSRSDSRYFVGKLSNRVFIEKIIKKIKPNYIFHLAANSTTKHDAIFENHDTISTGTVNILEAVRLFSPKTKVFLSGSAMQFKNIGEPINEDTPFCASSPYSVSRIQSVYMARYYRERFDLSVYIGYFFNHDSSLRTERHVNRLIVDGVKKIQKGELDSIVLGDINVQKEFNYAKDIVEAVWTLVNQENLFEAVVGSGKAYSIKDWVEICFGFINKDWKNYVEISQNYKADYDILVSNPKKIFSLGWRPKTSIHDLANIMFINKI